MEGELMKPRTKLLRYWIAVFFLAFPNLLFEQCFATPQNNQFDPYVIYSAKCSDKFYEKHEKTQVGFTLAPFYQQTHYARDGKGRKVPLNAMNGRWNMLAPFFSIADLTPKTFNQTNYPNLYSSKQKLLIDGVDYSDIKKYNPNNMYDEVTFASSKCDYEKFGLRGQIMIDSGFGLGLKIKTGVVDYKYTGSLHAAIDPYAVDPEGGETKNTDLAKGLYEALLTDQASSGIFKDLGLDLNKEHEVTLEDTHIELYVQVPYDFKEEGETVVIFSPYFSIGCWIPTGQEKDYNKFYSLPTGNNGHYGLTIEASLNFDFPGTVQLSVGGGVNLCDTHEYLMYRLPSNPYQEGFYPWVAKVEEKPGGTWYFNASFKAANFIKDLSFYFDFIHQHHEMDKMCIKDTICVRDDTCCVGNTCGYNACCGNTCGDGGTICSDDICDKYVCNLTASAKRQCILGKALCDFLTRSLWKDQKFNAGLIYRITDNLSLGGAIQAHISGVRVAKTTTVMGYMELKF
jgi:hypothetical protein